MKSDQLCENRPEPIANAWSAIAPRGTPFVKMHGLRNHFIIIDGRDVPFRPKTEQVTVICDPKIGVGGDQIVIIERPSERGLTKNAYAFMRIINTDGREVGACGNATRCVGHLLMEESGRDQVLLETVGGFLECARAGDLSVGVNLGAISMDWRDIPLSESRDTLNLDMEHGSLKYPAVLNIGNPHAVFFVADLDAIDLEELGPLVQNDPLFPEQVNVGVAQMINSELMRLSVYERPGILTAACGTGACVAVYAARERGLTSARRMTVEMSGGSLDIEINDDDTATMTGPVAFCFSGRLPA